MPDLSVPPGPATPFAVLRPRAPLAWGLAAALLALPAIAMNFTAEVQWTAFDFVLMGTLLFGAALLAELGFRVSGRARRPWPYRAGVAVAVAAGLLLIWINMAVGIVGAERHPANLLFHVIPMVALMGGALARFSGAGMARAMLVAAGGQVLAGALAGLLALPSPGDPGAIWRLALITALFAGLWLAADALFRRAA